MEKYDVAVVGAGLGGLQCAYILAKRGMKVVVFEKERLLGGCLQTFSRRGQHFDTGFHYVGGLDNGQPLNMLFKYFNLLDLPWQRLDNGFEHVVVDGKSYVFQQGFDNFEKQMVEYFPKSANQIKAYTAFLENVGNSIFGRFKHNINPDSNISDDKLFATGAYDWLEENISDKTLLNVLSGTGLKMQLDKQKLPLYIFAQINASFIQSAWRLKGGGMQIAMSLKQSIESMGGKVVNNAEVVNFVEKDNKIAFVEIKDAEPVEVDYVISNMHPAKTIELAANTSFIRNIYRKRINGLQNGYGVFTANIALKNNCVGYQNYNTYFYKNADVWEVQNNLQQPTCGLISFGVPKEGSFATNVDILSPMPWSMVEKFYGSQPMHRPQEYTDLKKHWADSVIKMANVYVPGLINSVENVYTSTPLTYSDYTGTMQGAAYGIVKDKNKLLQTLLTPKTPVPNLYMTGQNLSLHGILGVTMTSFFTCAEIVGGFPDDIF